MSVSRNSTDPITNRKTMEAFLDADHHTHTWRLEIHRAMFLAMYDSYCRAAKDHVATYCGTLKGWSGNFKATVDGSIQYLALSLFGKSDAAKDAWTREMQQGCAHTATAMWNGLKKAPPPPGWRAVIVDVGTAVHHVAAAACYAPTENKGDELLGPLNSGGYIFDPWICGKPYVWPFPGWRQRLHLLGFYFGYHGQEIGNVTDPTVCTGSCCSGSGKGGIGP
ncbi:MAG: hypothetical protein KKI08_05065 [Armatimonadetes bacterium]|nr:hypothetical protein [Armatimonadota bacterium]